MLAFAPLLIVALAIGLASVPVLAQSTTEAEALANYEAAKAAGRLAEATKYVLDYIVETEGENAPLTVSLTQRYGNQLRDEGDIREAIKVLKTARERAIIAFGEHGMGLFEINLDLGEAYVDRDIGVGRPLQYFDDALEVLRENGQRETILYVKTLVGVTARLTQAGALGGTFAADTYAGSIGDFIRTDATTEQGRNESGSGLTTVDYKYDTGYRVLEQYMQEAVELAETLNIQDPYLLAKVSIVQAKTKVLENVFLEVVPPTIRGSISGTKAQENYDQEDDNLLSAIDVLMEDAELNQGFVDIANSARMDIAWLSKDIERLADFCQGNTLNMASEYPPDRLFEIAPDGSVIAPRFSFRIKTNIFERPDASKYDDRNMNRQDRTQPQFVPVCINGRLMAALVHTPLVTIEDFE